MAKDGTLILELLDTTGKPLGEKVDIRVTHRVLNDDRRFSNVKTSPSPKLTEFHRTPQGLYTVEIDPPSYRCVRQFINIRPSGDTHLRIVFPIDPRKVRDLHAPDYDDLATDLKRILDRSSNLLAFTGKVGRELYEGLDPLRKAGVLNIAAKAGATILPGGTTVLHHIEQLTEVRGDRFFAVVTKELREETRNSVLAGMFMGVSGSLHHPPVGYEPAGSFKSDDQYGNLQLTFFVKGDEWVADIDIDDANGLQHVFQVIRNSIHGPTHPYDIREILLTHQQIDAGYVLVV
jgi:hypothetical protein